MGRKRRAIYSADALNALVGTKIGSAYLLVRRAFRAGMEETELTPLEFSVLAHVSSADIHQAALGLALSVSMQNLTPILDRLEQRGIIARVQSTSDRRVRMIHLTDLGQALMTRSATLVEMVEERLMAAMSPGERLIFIELLDKLCASAAAIDVATADGAEHADELLQAG